MMTDHDVIALYRCLLGRAPENADTIKAFQHYYADFDLGRQAVFRSEEFETYLAEVTGRRPAAEALAGGLALALLERAGRAAPVPADTALPAAAIRDGMAMVLARLPEPLLVVVVGEPSGLRLHDLVPVGAEATILHVAPGFPPVVPLVTRTQGGALLFRFACDAEGLAALLGGRGQRIGALFLAARPADATWLDALRPCLAEHAVVVTGPDGPGLDAGAVSRLAAERHPGEPVLAWSGLHLQCHGGWYLPVSYAPPAAMPRPPAKAGRPTLAIAAIMRDEAVCIVNMLRSVEGLMSFCALLDTGSTDGTPDLARAFLEQAKIENAIDMVPREKFQNRFADMRNAAMDMVPDHIDWILMLDADEEMVPEDFPALFALMAQPGAAAYALPRYNFPGADKDGEVTPYPDRQIRLLRNTPGGRLRYSGAVHETVRDAAALAPPLDGAALGCDRGGPHIHHLVRRFRNAEQEDRKQQFYREIAARHAAETITEIEPAS